MSSNSSKVLPLIIPAALVLKSNPQVLKADGLFTSSALNPQKISSLFNAQKMSQYAQQSEDVMNRVSSTVNMVKKINQLSTLQGLSGASILNDDGKIEQIISTLKEITPKASYHQTFDSISGTLDIVKKFSKAKKLLDIQQDITGTSLLSGGNPLGLLKSLTNSVSSLDLENNLDKIAKMATLFSTLTNDTETE